MNDERNDLKPKTTNNSAQKPVRPFGIQNTPNRNGSEEIKERLEASKKTNLNNETKRTSKDTASEITDTPSLAPKDGLTDGKEGLREKLNPKNIARNAAGAIGRNALNKAKENDEDDEEDSNTSNISNAVNKGINTIKDIKNAKALMSFFKTGAGKIVLLICVSLIGIILMAAVASVLSNPFQLIISSIGMKFGLTGESTYKFSTSDDEEYNYYYNNDDRVYREGMTRKEVEEMIEVNDGKLDCSKEQTIFRKVWLFITNDYDLTDPCEFMQYLKKQLEKKEHLTDLTIAPGYIMNTFYYSFETQNYDENGEPFITSYLDNDAEKEKNDEMQGSNDVTSDLDAINLMFGHKRANGSKIFVKEDINTLIDEYLLKMHYYFWVYEKVNDDPEEWDCVRYKSSENGTYSIDVDKYKLFLRYGHDVSYGYRTVDADPSMPKSGNRGYQADKNIIASYNATSSECIYKVEDTYGEKPPSLQIYELKAYPDDVGDDRAQFTLANGKTYNYSTGFIFTRYPRYMEEFTTTGTVTFDFFVAKEIEKFIEHISDRQDYANYLLGYDSDVGKLVGRKGNGSTDSFEVECDYSELGEETTGERTDGDNSLTTTNTSGIKVVLTYPRKGAMSFDAFDFESYAPIDGKMISLEDYVLGAVYAEAGGEFLQSSVFVTSIEATTKAYSIMTRSFALANGVTDTINGQTVLKIPNSTSGSQTYCDPNNGCYRCSHSSNGNNIIILPYDSPLAIDNPQCTFSEKLPENSPLRQYVKETVGQVLVNSNGKVASTGYDEKKLKQWFKATNTDTSIADFDYIELLQYQYGDQNFTLKTVDCDIKYTGDGTDYVATGPWDSWRQGGNEPWANQPFGAGATMANAGCLITSYAKLLADSGGNLLIDNFNPGNFVLALNANDCFEGNLLRNECALRTAVGEGHYTYNAGSLSGSFENKRAFITSKMNEGYQVIISVKNDGHWVYVTGTTSDDILMSDPAGRGTSVRDTYGNTSISYKLIKIF